MKSKQDNEVIGLCIVCILMMIIIICLIFDNVTIREQYESQQTDESAYHSRDWGGDDSERLAQLAMYMAKDKNIEAKMTIINIAINRVWDNDYPDTIEGVVYDMTDGMYVNEEPDYECLDAEHHVQIDGWDLSNGATDFEIVDGEIILK